MTDDISIRDCTTQRLEIRMQGPGLARLGPPLMTADGFADLEMPADLDGFLELSDGDLADVPMPDLVGLFVLAVDAGLFGSVGDSRATAAATTVFDQGSDTRTWTLDIVDTPTSALRVLIELLAHGDAQAWSIASVDGMGTAPFKSVGSLAWPAIPGVRDFMSQVHSAQALANASEITVQIRFAEPPSPAVQAEGDRAM
jgi:hypothetical protein